MHTNRADAAVSPVVGVILVVAVTVILSAVIGAFVFNLGSSIGSSQTGTDLGITTIPHPDTGELTVRVITGEADRLDVRVAGTVETTLTNPSPGDEATVAVSEGDDLAVITTTDGKESIAYSDPDPMKGTSPTLTYPLLIDAFDDVSGYTKSYNAGGGDFTVASSPARDGTSARLDTHSGGSTAFENTPDGTLDTYPKKGDTVSFWWQSSSSGIVRLVLDDTEGDDGRFFARYWVASNRMDIGGTDNTGSTISSTTSPSLSASTWYRVEVTLNDDAAGTADVTIYDADGTELATDSIETHLPSDALAVEWSGGVEGSGSSTTYYDEFFVTDSTTR